MKTKVLTDRNLVGASAQDLPIGGQPEMLCPVDWAAGLRRDLGGGPGLSRGAGEYPPGSGGGGAGALPLFPGTWGGEVS